MHVFFAGNNEIKNYIAMYNDLPKLLYLNLAGNNISLIYSEDFQYPELTDLDLSRNQITSIGMHSFAGEDFSLGVKIMKMIIF